jgi:integrase
MSKNYCSENPADKIRPIKIDQPDPESYNVNQVKRILRAARDIRGGEFLPYVVVSLFGGLRPEEAQKIQWADIRLDDGDATISLSGKAAKKRSRRVVELSSNAVEWLLSCQGLPIYPESARAIGLEVRMAAGFQVDQKDEKRLRKKFKVEEDAELEPWIFDGLRHTALTMHYVQHGDKSLTAFWAGNSPDMLDERYRSLASKSEAAAFWSITPDNVDNDGEVVDMKAVAS